MPAVSRKRRATAVEEAASESEAEAERPQTQQRRQRHRSEESDAHGQGSDPEDAGAGANVVEELSRKLVRHAMSCEYSRTPIRRADLVSKVLGPTQSRQFNAVFQEAQLMLRATFGMEMTELPMREKVTLAQRRAAQKVEKQTTSTNAWVLTSTLPDKYRSTAILQPPKIPTVSHESAYIALYTQIIAIIYLAGGKLPDSKLERYLRRMNADQSTPVDKTDKLLLRLIKEGYITKIKDSSSGEDMIEYMVGPRGKAEVGAEGVGNMVRTVYGSGVEDLEKRLERSLGLATSTQTGVVPGKIAAKKGKRRRTTQAADGEEEEDDDGELTLDESNSE